MEEIGFIVSTKTIFSEGKTYVHLYGRTTKGKAFHTQSIVRPYFFIKEEDAKKAQAACPLDIKQTSMETYEGKKASKVTFASMELRKEAADLLKKKEITLYEADVGAEEQFFHDLLLYATVHIKGERDSLGTYLDPVLKPAEDDVSLRLLCFDIETSKKSEIISVSLYGKDLQEVIMVAKGKVRGITTVPDEKALLETFFLRVKTYDPDIISGWNLIDFDLQVMRTRARAHKLPLALGKEGEECRLSISTDFIRDSHAVCPGRAVIDGIAALKMNFVSLDDYKLNTAAREILGSKKETIIEKEGDDQWGAINRLYEQDKKRLASYNLTDARLVHEILEKKELIKLLKRRSAITGMRLDKVRQSIRSLDSMYLKEAHKRGIVCPTAFTNQKDEAVEGAYVMASKPGIYELMLVLDFKSLYPSIMRTYNIDPYTQSKNGKIRCANGVRFDRKPGILPEILEKLWQSRDEAKTRKDSVGSWAFKVTMNSFYGSLANPTCRFFSMDIANAITATARAIIKETIELIESWGYDVIYSDTDSIFVHAKAGSLKETRVLGAKLERDVNKHFTAKIKKAFGVPSFIELQYDKTYRIFFMPRIRDSREGAKKRYAGLLIDTDENTRIDVVGLEYVRRDWTKLAKQFQWHLLEIIFTDHDASKKKEELARYIKDYVAKLRAHKLDDLLVYSKSLTKPLHAYTKTTPPHVKAAKKLKKVTSRRITYVMTSNGPEPTQDIRHETDYEHYIEKQIRPVANSILEWFGTSFDDLSKGHQQKTLAGF